MLRRRELLGIGAGMVAATTLTSCQTGGAKPDPMAPGEDEPPSSEPYAGVEPDLPASEGVPAGYFHYPANPPEFHSGEVGASSAIIAMLEGMHVTTPKANNPWLQNLDRLLNVDLGVNAVRSSDYSSKLSVVLAGGDLPDLVQVPPSTPDLPQILDKLFVDLGPYIGGDKVAEYPGLAALPPSAWTAGMVNGRLYGITQPRSSAGRTWTARTDIIKQLGLNFDDVSDGAALLDFCREVTDVRSKRWAFGQDPTAWLVRAILEMTEGPNRWAVEDGKYVRDIESEQYTTALDVVRRLWEEELIHPDSFGAPAPNWWPAGTTVFFIQAFEGWSRHHLTNPDIGIAAVQPPKWDGGGPAAKQLGPGHYINFIAIKKADDERVRELLRVMNYLAAPFGTSEYLAVNYGVEGTHYALDGANPIPNNTAADHKSASIPYIGGTEFSVLYVAGEDDLVRQQHEYLSAVIPGGIADAHLGKFSPTEVTDGAAEEPRLNDLQNEIIQGRQPVSAFADAVASWRTAVGDKIRDEYANAK